MKVTETSEEAFVLTPGKYTVFLVDEADNKINITE